MQVNLLKSKILRAEVTDCNLHYEGSLAIDAEFMEKVALLPYEKILVGNITTGARFETYAILASEGSKTIALNGAAARLGTVGDLLVIISFVQMDLTEAPQWKPRVLVLGDRNQTIVKTQNI